MSNPPWATDSNTNSNHFGNPADSNLRTSDINVPYRKKINPRHSESLKTHDIVIPKKKHTNRVWDGQGLSNLKTQDIAGQHNRVSHPFGPSCSQYGTGFKPYNSLEVRDIDGAYAKRNRDPRNTSPLDPTYKLPSHKTAPPPEPKFIRDSVRVHDVAGAQVSQKYKQFRTKQINKVEDIPGTKPLPQTFSRTFGHAPEILSHRDITATEFKTKRLGHSPLEPKYTYGRSSDLNMSTILDMPASEALKAKLSTTAKMQKGQKKQIFGEIKGAKPAPIPPQKSLPHRSSSLRTSDVPGAYQGWTPEWEAPRREFGHPTRTDDIPGAQAGTKKKLVTKRNVDPLAPKYKTLDGRSRPQKRNQLRSTGREISQVVLG
mmetsp:Transcript_23503/g.32805  ORF Transcript_23503/g.32805 Transcript_23503/m.32805 type:complete len:373 (-) Transcript_23503:2807-3925(-)|eukprot:CAMPEP_0184483466 /NCGR_PEP_ID=MMETSP0113_2-20130426/5114_1 /TAXON_ID=91329 /ORGANISM="Norrisiella sphaerica, Strain BC52" /LENGTH=372 /DNA_ID=CAMNT_0026863883 /DNA_START=105 /DNA_END=1223 /DNA_ORIENTATION=+